MANWEKESEVKEIRKEVLIRIIEHSLQLLSVEELEAIYYDLLTTDYIRT